MYKIHRSPDYWLQLLMWIIFPYDIKQSTYMLRATFAYVWVILWPYMYQARFEHPRVRWQMKKSVFI